MVAERIRALRKSHNWTQKHLAKLLQVSNKRVSSWETTEELPSTEMIVRLSKVFSVTTDYLLGVDDKKVIVVEGLTEGECAALQEIANSLAKANGNHVNS